MEATLVTAEAVKAVINCAPQVHQVELSVCGIETEDNSVDYALLCTTRTRSWDRAPNLMFGRGNDGLTPRYQRAVRKCAKCIEADDNKVNPGGTKIGDATTNMSTEARGSKVRGATREGGIKMVKTNTLSSSNDEVRIGVNVCTIFLSGNVRCKENYDESNE